ncbi:PTS mannose transporter subunit IID, partial [Salmonella enterica]
MKKNKTEKKITHSDIRGVFLRTNIFQWTYNLEKIKHQGILYYIVT